MNAVIGATVMRGFGVASRNLKLQMPHLIWQFPELKNIYTATINVQLERSLRIAKLERTTPPLPWWDVDVNNTDSGRWHVEQFSIVPIEFECPIKAPTIEAWLFMSHGSAIFRNPYHYEIVTEKIDTLAPGRHCKISYSENRPHRHRVKTATLSVIAASSSRDPHHPTSCAADEMRSWASMR